MLLNRPPLAEGQEIFDPEGRENLCEGLELRAKKTQEAFRAIVRPLPEKRECVFRPSLKGRVMNTRFPQISRSGVVVGLICGRDVVMDRVVQTTNRQNEAYAHLDKKVDAARRRVSVWRGCETLSKFVIVGVLLGGVGYVGYDLSSSGFVVQDAVASVDNALSAAKQIAGAAYSHWPLFLGAFAANVARGFCKDQRLEAERDERIWSCRPKITDHLKR